MRKYIKKSREHEFSYVHSNKAKIDSLEYYFKNNFADVNNIYNIEFLNESKIKEDKSWIDWDCVSGISESVEYYKKYARIKSKKPNSIYQPSRCIKCENVFIPYRMGLHGKQKNAEKRIYLPKDNYIRMPLKKGDCGRCEESA